MSRTFILCLGAVLMTGVLSPRVAFADQVQCAATAAMPDRSTPALSSSSNVVGRYTTGPYYEISCFYDVTVTTSAAKEKACASEVLVETTGRTPSGWRAYDAMADFVSYKAGTGGQPGTCYYRNRNAKLYRITFAQAKYTCTPKGSSKQNRVYTCEEK